MSDINIKRQVFDRSAFDNTINTTFTELTSSLNVIPEPTIITIEEFFGYYNDLFYNIPKFGSTESHEYLIITSQQYVGPTTVDTQLIDALIAEVTELRQENLILQQDLANTAIKTAEEALTQLRDING
mgnify:CR=1 FL=1|tara:strand:+ start:3608 stop:3991 length:384 start_codon:yes stop_codon:yes gene_type:complete